MINMANGELLSTGVDKDGRNMLMDSSAISIVYYDASGESWDRTGDGGQSWATELNSPSDLFNAASLSADRWDIIDTTSSKYSIVTGAGLLVGVEKAEGSFYISSRNKWKMSGDFDVRVYVDWDSYYNEYRGITDSFVEIGVDDSTAVRLSLTWDGTSFVFRSQSNISRDPKFFDWDDNGASLSFTSFEQVKQYGVMCIARTGGELKCYVISDQSQVQVGNSVTDSALSTEVGLKIGVQAKEYNTIRTLYNKVSVAGTISPPQTFFSSLRGTAVAFPQKSIIVVDTKSLSILDITDFTMWGRVVFGNKSVLQSPPQSVAACNGSIFCGTNNGIVELDLQKDRILRYREGDVEALQEPVSLRNSVGQYYLLNPSAGALPSSNVTGLDCYNSSGNTIVAVATSSGVAVVTTTTSGITTSMGNSPQVTSVAITTAGDLFWSTYDTTASSVDLSYRTGITTLPSGTFTRTGYYTPTTVPIYIMDSKINSISALGSANNKLVALGSESGITYISQDQGTKTFGVASSQITIKDPFFTSYPSVTWAVENSSLREDVVVERAPSITGGSGNSYKFSMSDPATLGGFIPKDTKVGVTQQVDLSGNSSLFFDIKIDMPTTGAFTNTPSWVAEIVIGGLVYKTYQDVDGPLVIVNESIDVTSVTSTEVLEIRIRAVADLGVQNTSQRAFYIGNFRTFLQETTDPVLPLGQANALEVLLQHDENGKKVYFTTPGGYGAIDLTDNSLDYFNYIEGILPGASISSADFSRNSGG